MSKCKSQERIFVIGDLNAKVDNGRDEDIVGQYGLGQRNNRGETKINWCKKQGQVIFNTWFKHHYYGREETLEVNQKITLIVIRNTIFL